MRQRTNQGSVSFSDDEFVIGPCGSRVLDLFIECKGLNPFPGRTGDRCWVPLSPLHPFPPFRAAWARTQYPPPQRDPFPRKTTI
jgi:hypothetical protein